MILRDGDIISIDTGAVLDGWVGDNAWTFFVGTPTPEAKALCEVTRDCLKAAIEQAVPGNHIGDVGYAVQSLAESHGYGVLRDYVGHGIGRVMHEDPNVPNYGKKGRGVRLQAGMVIAIEPMVTMGSNHVSTGSDGWIVTTNDHLPAAHYENTVAITNDGPVILTTDAKVLGAPSKAEKCKSRRPLMPNLAFQFRRHDPKVYSFSFQGDLGHQGTALFYISNVTSST